MYTVPVLQIAMCSQCHTGFATEFISALRVNVSVFENTRKYFFQCHAGFATDLIATLRVEASRFETREKYFLVEFFSRHIVLVGPLGDNFSRR